MTTSRYKKSSPVRTLAKFVIIAVFIFLGTGLIKRDIADGIQVKKLLQNPTLVAYPSNYAVPTSSYNYPKATYDNSEQGRYTIVSPNNKYSLTIIARLSEKNDEGTEFECDYFVLSGLSEISLPNSFAKKIMCHIWGMVPNGYPVNFVAVNDDGLIVEEENGILNVFRFSTGQTSAYKYDYNQLEVNAVSKDFSFWLFTEKTKTHNLRKYVITDQNKNNLKRFELPYNDRPPLYDEVNNGFLLIGRNYNNDFVSVTFDYLKLPSLELNHLLSTELTEVPGRGCGGEELIPAVDEIVLTQGCLTVPQKYIGKDNYIHIPLIK